MSRRIEIELTSARPDGTWTWRAAGAREPKGVVEATILPDSPKVGDVLKVEADFELEGISILSVVTGGRSRKEPTLIELIPVERPFEPVMQTLAGRERGDRADRGDRPRRDRPDRPRRDDDRRGPRTDSDRRGPRPDGAPSGERSDRPRRDRPDRPPRPRFEAPPELPQRPRPKRLKPGKAHRTAVLTELPEAQRAIADKALQGGIPAVRQAVNEQNAALRAEGKEEIPAAGLLKIAEELLPRLRVAEWLDRADAAKADLEDLDLRDLRSVVAAADDPMVTRDETARELANELKAALVTKQEKASQEWLEDIGLALGVGRVIRALKLSSEPPKAGMRFPADLAQQLATAATESLTIEATADRWSAVLEAVAFSPIRTHVTPAAPPTTGSDELTVTVTRLAPLIPQIAAVFGITAAPGAPMPKPQRAPRKPDRKPGAGAGGAGAGTGGAGSGTGPRPPREAGSRPPKQAKQARPPKPPESKPSEEPSNQPAARTDQTDQTDQTDSSTDSVPAQVGEPSPALAQAPEPADTPGATPTKTAAVSEPSSQQVMDPADTAPSSETADAPETEGAAVAEPTTPSEATDTTDTTEASDAPDVIEVSDAPEATDLVTPSGATDTADAAAPIEKTDAADTSPSDHHAASASAESAALNEPVSPPVASSTEATAAATSSEMRDTADATEESSANEQPASPRPSNTE